LHARPVASAIAVSDVTPKLDAFSLAEIARATGLSLAACSRVRAGTRVPHPRHRPAFVALVNEGSAPVAFCMHADAELRHLVAFVRASCSFFMRVYFDFACQLCDHIWLRSGSSLRVDSARYP
jgi:hypothetical protein